MATAAAQQTEKLGQILLQEGLITRDQLGQALAEQKASKSRLGLAVVKLGFATELDVTRLLARQYRMPAVDLSRFEVDARILRLIPPDVASKQVVLPLKREGRTLTVAVADPTNLGLVDDLKFITRYDVFPVLAGEFTLRSLIDKHYGNAVDQQFQNILKEFEEQGDDVEVVDEEEEELATQAQIDDAPVVKLVEGILKNAVQRGASDIHIEPFEHEIRVR